MITIPKGNSPNCPMPKNRPNKYPKSEHEKGPSTVHSFYLQNKMREGIPVNGQTPENPPANFSWLNRYRRNLYEEFVTLILPFRLAAVA